MPGFWFLAIEIRSQKIGYTIFEDSRLLLDWGVRSFAKEVGVELRRKTTKLIEQFEPTIILLSKVDLSNRRNGNSVNNALRVITEAAEIFSISVRVSAKNYLRQHFANIGRWNKRDIAEAIAKRFPDLAWHMPHRKKMWHSEPKEQLVFDSAALALHFFATEKRNQYLETLWSAPDDE